MPKKIDVLVFSIAFEVVICQIFVISSHKFLALWFHTASTSDFFHLKGFNSQRWGACPAASHHRLDRVVKFCWWGLYLLESPLLHFDYFSASGLSKFAARPTFCIVEKADGLDLISIWA